MDDDRRRKDPGGLQGAPGGEDCQNGWISPDNPDIILLAADQGAVVTHNGGETWSSRYNQSIAQIDHVGADDVRPESGLRTLAFRSAGRQT